MKSNRLDSSSMTVEVPGAEPENWHEKQDGGVGG
jgi:hypothetical protein